MPIDKLKDPMVDRLFRAIQTLRTMDEYYRFFDDLCTVNEVMAMAQRLAVASMLRQGATYTQIEAETGASTATISRVKRGLAYGASGIELALQRLEEEERLSSKPESQSRRK